MEITSNRGENFLGLKLAGRFDGNWAPHVGSAIEEAIRGGHRQIELDLSGVNYISSAGVRILFKYHRTLSTARGNLRIVGADENVMSVLELSGLAAVLLEQVSAPEPAAEAWEWEGTSFEEHVLSPVSVLRGRRHGHERMLFRVTKLAGIERCANQHIARIECEISTKLPLWLQQTQGARTALSQRARQGQPTRHPGSDAVRHW